MTKKILSAVVAVAFLAVAGPSFADDAAKAVEATKAQGAKSVDATKAEGTKAVESSKAKTKKAPTDTKAAVKDAAKWLRKNSTGGAHGQAARPFLVFGGASGAGGDDLSGEHLSILANPESGGWSAARFQEPDTLPRTRRALPWRGVPDHRRRRETSLPRPER